MQTNRQDRLTTDSFIKNIVDTLIKFYHWFSLINETQHQNDQANSSLDFKEEIKELEGTLETKIDWILNYDEERDSLEELLTKQSQLNEAKKECEDHLEKLLKQQQEVVTYNQGLLATDQSIDTDGSLQNSSAKDEELAELLLQEEIQEKILAILELLEAARITNDANCIRPALLCAITLMTELEDITKTDFLNSFITDNREVLINELLELQGQASNVESLDDDRTEYRTGSVDSIANAPVSVLGRHQLGGQQCGIESLGAPRTSLTNASAGNVYTPIYPSFTVF